MKKERYSRGQNKSVVIIGLLSSTNNAARRGEWKGRRKMYISTESLFRCSPDVRCFSFRCLPSSVYNTYFHVKGLFSISTGKKKCDWTRVLLRLQTFTRTGSRETVVTLDSLGHGRWWMSPEQYTLFIWRKTNSMTRNLWVNRRRHSKGLANRLERTIKVYPQFDRTLSYLLYTSLWCPGQGKILGGTVWSSIIFLRFRPYI